MIFALLWVEIILVSIVSWHVTITRLQPLHPQSQSTAIFADLADLAYPTDLPFVLFMIFGTIVGAAHSRRAAIDGGIGSGADIELGKWVVVNVKLV
jgi:hypothetical protein